MNYKVGYRQGAFIDPERPDWSGQGSRPITWSAWYPAPNCTQGEPQFRGPPDAPWFVMGDLAPDAPIDAGVASWPVVVLSHGTGGSADGIGWLGYRLAQAGFVVLGVNHHGNTMMEPYRAEGFACWWERARDLSVLLDQHIEAGFFANRLDTRNVFAAGFSLGGYTVMALGGAITDMDRFDTWAKRNLESQGPREFPELAQAIPRLFETSAVFRHSWQRHGMSYRDERIRSLMVLAPPPPVRAFTEESLEAMRIPVRMLVGGGDREAPPDTCARWLADCLPDGELTVLGDDVGHYVFLPEATGEGKVAMPDICVDPPGVDRREIHRVAAQMALLRYRSALTGIDECV